MQNTVVERALSSESEGRELSFPDVEAIVMDCVSETADAFSVQQRLMDTIAQATKEISRLGEAQAHRYVKCLTSIAKGLRRNTEEHHTFRFFYFGQFQARVEQLEQELEHSFSEMRVMSVANRKHFAPIMRLLYSEQVCQQQKLADKLRIDRSNLSRELRHLEDSGLAESTTVGGRFRYYRLTPQGRRYYDTYLIMKNQLEEQIYSPQDGSAPIKESSPQYVLALASDGHGYLPSNSYKEESLFTDEDTKSRPKMIYDFYDYIIIRRDN